MQQIDSLSGGQKSRVAFAVLCGHNPNFLVLGESLLKISSEIKCISQQKSLYCQLNPCELDILDISTVGLARMPSQRVFRSLIKYISERSYRSLIISSSALLSISPLYMKLSIILTTSGFTSLRLITPVAFSNMSVCNILLKTGEYEARIIWWQRNCQEPTLISMSGNSLSWSTEDIMAFLIGFNLNISMSNSATVKTL